MATYAYSDPPYLGCCQKYDHDHGDDGRCWNEPRTHELLIERVVDEFPDGFALSLSVPSLRLYLDACPADARVAAWTKPFASFKPNVNPAYCWEPVILRGGRARRDRTEPTVRDYLAEPITLQRGLTGAKSERFCRWVLHLLGYRGGDTVIDLFPGTGVMGRVLDHLPLDFDAPPAVENAAEL